MKRFILILSLISSMIMMIGCEPMENKLVNNQVRTNTGVNIYTVEYDNCEYVVAEEIFGQGVGLGITHKENCKYCKMRKND